MYLTSSEIQMVLSAGNLIAITVQLKRVCHSAQCTS